LDDKHQNLQHRSIQLLQLSSNTFAVFALRKPVYR